jgi:hypothetical protein
VTPGSIEFLAESSLSLLSEPHLVRMRTNGFKAILPGVESWYFAREQGGRRKQDDRPATRFITCLST